MKDLMQKYKKITGVVFIILGILALITPLTPGSWLIFVGLELIGMRLAFYKNLQNAIMNLVTRYSKENND
ncbi:MAG: hypothetical protein Q7T51_03755 [Candidatus Moranbacteria bacterium]|nr:hypothetical protein [Candidatus Moranbacteria bacterium]